jgi:hypothetical protein
MQGNSNYLRKALNVKKEGREKIEPVVIEKSVFMRFWLCSIQKLRYV